MKVNEVFKSIFESVFLHEYPILYKVVFGDDADAKKIDALFLYKYGEKTVTAGISIDNANAVASSVIWQYYDNWQHQAQLLGLEYDVLKPELSSETVKENATVSENDSNTATASSTTFNEPTFADDTKRQTERTGGRTEESTRTVTRTGLNTSSTEAVKQELAFRRRTNLKEQVLYELAKEITIDIY